jgi:hypothetical protein
VPTVQAFSPGGQAAVVGQLTRPRSDSSGVSAGPVGCVLGGYDGTRPVPTVTTSRLVTTGQMVPNEATSPWLAPAASPGELAPGSDPERAV